jgi:small nuclear ribonucleoprotein E
VFAGAAPLSRPILSLHGLPGAVYPGPPRAPSRPSPHAHTLTRLQAHTLTSSLGLAHLALSSQNLIFRFLQSQQRIQVWLYDNANAMIEGRLIGFDEYMNLVLDDCEEIRVKKDARTSSTLGRILLKGDNISLLLQAPVSS